jgi:hypothetical protein
LIRSSALFLSLSPPTREYFRQLGEIGESEFVSLLEQDRDALAPGRGWTLQEDLSQEISRAANALERLDRLEQALEGRYMDFRVSPSLENINFVFDRTAGEPVLYRSVAKPAHPRAHGDELTFVFAPLRLEARETYRLILIGYRSARFGSNDQIAAEVLVNPGEGYANAPVYQRARVEVEGHKNFAVDFKAPADVVSISDLRVTVRNQPIRSAMLYVRTRLQSGMGDAVARAVPPRPPRPVPEPEPFPADATKTGQRKRRSITEI